MNRLRYVFYKKEDEKISSFKKFVNSFIVLGLFISFMLFSFSRLHYIQKWDVLWKYRENIFNGFIATLIISLFSLFLSLIIGLISALASQSKILPLYYTSSYYVAIIRNTPLIVQIMLFFYVVGTAFKISDLYIFGLVISDRYVLGVIILSIFSGAYMSEIIRGGIESIPHSQIESARSIGFTNFQMYLYVILPQVITRVLPGLTGQLVSLVKDSSLLSIIAISELTKAVQEVNSITYVGIENYVYLAGFYLMITIPLSALAKYLEKRFSYEH